MRAYFYLRPECRLVPGPLGAAVFNLRSCEIIRLHPENAAVLRDAELSRAVPADHPVLQELAAMAWGFFSESKVFIDKSRPYHQFIRERLDLNPPPLGTVTIQVTNQCNLSCAACGEYFCPVCFSRRDACELEPDQWLRIVDALFAAGARNFILSGGNPVLSPSTEVIKNHILRLGANASVITNGLAGIPDWPESLGEILIFLPEESRIPALVSVLGKTKRKVVLIADTVFTPGNLAPLEPYVKAKHLTSYREPRLASNKDLKGVDVNTFHLRADYDDCLKGKLYLRADGALVPCFQRRDRVVGNLAEEFLRPVFRKLVEEYWVSGPERLRSGKCSDCELFFGCNTCSCFTPENCLYLPDLGQWNSETSTVADYVPAK